MSQPAASSARSYSEKLGTGSRAVPGRRVWHRRQISSAAPVPQTIRSAGLPYSRAKASRSFVQALSG